MFLFNAAVSSGYILAYLVVTSQTRCSTSSASPSHTTSTTPALPSSPANTALLIAICALCVALADAQVALRPRLQAGAAPRPLSHGAERGARVSAGQDGRGARGASAADDGAQCATGRRRHASRALRRAGRGARQVRDHRVLSDAVHARADLHPLCLQERHPKQRRRKGNPLRRAADAARCGPLAQRFEQPCAGSLALQHVTR
eukprot:3190390-Pleurochrysis_carterae.AAC.3